MLAQISRLPATIALAVGLCAAPSVNAAVLAPGQNLQVSYDSSSVPGPIDYLAPSIDFIAPHGFPLLSSFQLQFFDSTGNAVSPIATYSNLGGFDFYGGLGFGLPFSVSMPSAGYALLSAASTEIDIASVWFRPAYQDTFYRDSNGSLIDLPTTLTAVSVPGPILGAGLPGLVMALGGGLLALRRHRNQAAVA